MFAAYAGNVNSNPVTQKAARRAHNPKLVTDNNVVRPSRINIAPEIARLQGLLEESRSQVRLLEEKVDTLQYQKAGLQLELEEYRESATGKKLKSLESRYTLQHIVKWVCRVYGVTEQEMASRRRGKRLSLARKACYFYAYTYTKHSFPDIGGALGKDHTTVLSGYRRYRDMSRVDKMAVRKAETRDK